MAASNKKVYNVAVLLYTGTDILDFAGPIEMLSHTLYNTDIENPEPVFKPTLIASGPEILAGNCMTVKADMSIAAALPKIGDFDILVVPGGWPTLLLNMIKSRSEEVEFIEAFNQYSAPPHDQGPGNGEGAGKGDEKIILSICTGALFLGATGVLAGLKATTHHMSLGLLRETDPSIEVLSSVTEKEKPRRYVDGGLNRQGKRVVTAGGITCGLDAALYIGEMKAGRQAAEFNARMSEHEWKRV